MSVNQKPIKVCFVSPKAYPLFNPDIKEVFGGAEVDLYYLATELAKDENFRISFIVADYGQKKIEELQNITVIKSLTFRENSLIAAGKIWRAMKNADSQIYFQETSSWGTFLVSLFCKLKNKKFIYRTAHKNECDGTYIKEYRIQGKAFKWALRNADEVIVQNASDQNDIKKLMGIDTMVIPNGHYLSDIKQIDKDYILWVGRSAQFKRPYLFIDLAEEFPDEKFVMICQRATGDENYEQLVSKAKQTENLHFIRRVPFADIDDYFQSAKVFINTSEAEGFPNTFIQSCKAGTPILSLNVNPDGFLDEYNCGICANDDWQEFVKHLKTLLSEHDELRNLAQNARKYAEEKHDIEKIAEKYKTLFLILTGNN